MFKFMLRLHIAAARGAFGAVLDEVFGPEEGGDYVSRCQPAPQ